MSGRGGYQINVKMAGLFAVDAVAELKELLQIYSTWITLRENE
jgi:hypothetical protein